MFEGIKKFFGFGPKPIIKPPTPDTNIKVHPVTVNPTPAQQELRHATRLHTLHLALDQKGYRPEDYEAVKAEILRRQNALIAMGHKAPVSIAEAEALVQAIQEGKT